MVRGLLLFLLHVVIFDLLPVGPNILDGLDCSGGSTLRIIFLIKFGWTLLQWDQHVTYYIFFFWPNPIFCVALFKSAKWTKFWGPWRRGLSGLPVPALVIVRTL